MALGVAYPLHKGRCPSDASRHSPRSILTNSKRKFRGMICVGHAWDMRGTSVGQTVPIGGGSC